MNSVRHFASTCANFHPPVSRFMHVVDRGNRNISPLHTYHVIAIRICRRQSLGGGMFVLRKRPWQADNFQHVIAVVQG